MTRIRMLLSLALLTGCTSLIGVPDLTYDDLAAQGTPGGSVGPSGNSGTGAQCLPFDRSRLTALLLADGGLPPLPPPVGGIQ
jgi:hypothetical protein